MMTAKERKTLVDELNEKFSHNKDENPIIFSPKERPDLIQIELVPCNVEQINEALGGGFPRSTMIYITGDEGSGKTSIALSLCKQHLEAGRMAVYVNGEGGFPQLQCEVLGLDVNDDNFLVMQPDDYGEQMIDAIYHLLYDPKKRMARPNMGIIVFDSLNSIVPKSVIDRAEEKGSEAAGMMERPRVISQFLERVMGRGMLRGGCQLVTIAQKRTELVGMYAIQTGSGGRSTKYVPKILIDLNRKVIKEKIRDVRTPVGMEVTYEVIKNNVNKPPTAGRYIYTYGTGVDDTAALFNAGLDKGLVWKSGRKYKFALPGFEELEAPSLKQKAIEFLNEDSGLKEALRNALRSGTETNEQTVSDTDEQEGN